MTLEDVMLWLKTLDTKADNYYCGTLNGKKDKSFGVYQLKDRRKNGIALGGAETTLTETKGISILVHWLASTRATEQTATDLYNDIQTAENIVIGGRKADYIDLLYNEPIDVGTDDNGICEQVIEMIIYYERND